MDKNNLPKNKPGGFKLYRHLDSIFLSLIIYLDRNVMKIFATYCLKILSSLYLLIFLARLNDLPQTSH